MFGSRGVEFGPRRNKHVLGVYELYPFLPDSIQAILIAGNMLVLIIAFCGNVAAFAIIAQAKSSKRVTKLFLSSLAISDLILVISACPIDLGKLTDKYNAWIFGTFLCTVTAPVQTYGIIMNAACLFGIAFERYLSVIRSPKLSKISPFLETKLPYIILALAWIFPLGPSIPMFWAHEEWSMYIMTRPNETGPYVRLDNQTHYMCQANDKFDWGAELFSILGIVYFGLLLGLVFCYGSIINFVQERGVNFARPPSSSVTTISATNITPNKIINSETNDLSSSDAISTAPKSTTKSTTTTSSSPLPSAFITNSKHQHRRTIKLIMALILFYLICRTPIFIFNLVVHYKKIRKTVSSVSITYFLHLLSNIKCGINPFLYVIWNNSLKSSPNSKNLNIKSKRGCFCFGKKPTSDNNFTKVRFTNNATSSIANIFRLRHNSFSFKTQTPSKVFPSPSVAQKFASNDRNEFVSQIATAPALPHWETIENA